MSSPIPRDANVVFVDGECVFCNRVVSFILKHDKAGTFHFAQLQGELASEVLGRHGRSARDVDSVYVLVHAGTRDEKLYWDGRAARAIWPKLFWFGAVLHWIPLPALDFAYRAFARRRYRLFGRYDVCHVPSQNDRARFLDLGASDGLAS